MLSLETGRNDVSGYLETCAALGLIFLSHQMIQLNPRIMEYANVMEVVMYNAALVGLALDGRSFFYDNPLATIGKHLSRKDWFEVSCCPPNVSSTDILTYYESDRRRLLDF